MRRKLIHKAYEKSLPIPRRYYTNQDEFNADIEDPRHVNYFIHGFGGAPGQAGLVQPVIEKVLGPSHYIKCMRIPELDVTRHECDKYKLDTTDKIRARIISDLEALHERFGSDKRIMVMISSHGMYDFLYAYDGIRAEIRKTLRLLWVACAADEYEGLKTKHRWTTRFLIWLTGFELDGYRWNFSPNTQFLSRINPECATHFKFTDSQGNQQIYWKHDIEFRFPFVGLEWTAPGSIEHMEAYLDRQIRRLQGPIEDIKCWCLAGLNDGYWYEPTEQKIEATVQKYFRNFYITCRDTSHLWITTPPFMEDFCRQFAKAEGLLGQDSQ